jgi:predicted nucleotidyltransferase
MLPGIAGEAVAVLEPSSVVRSVLLHGSIAAGEVTLGFSDIDLIVNLHWPSPESMDGPEFLAVRERIPDITGIAPDVRVV